MTQPTKGIGLHIGLNSVDPKHYSGWSGDLLACESDAIDMLALAKAQRYTSTILLTAAATYSAVEKAVAAAANAANPGDIFFLTYSGHGGQLPDKNGDEDDDLDETWCLYDREVPDDVLYGWFGKFKPGVRIFMLSDSCHSGSVNKDQFDVLMAQWAPLRRYDPFTGEVLGPKFRGMPMDVARRTYLQNRSQYDEMLESADPDARAKVAASVRLISGCRDDQLSSDGMFNGAFTSRVKRIWKNGDFKGNYADYHAAILARMPKSQQPVHSVVGAADPIFDAQRPYQI